MSTTTLLQRQVAMLYLFGIGPSKARYILSLIPDLEMFFSLPDEHLAKILKTKLSVVTKMNRSRALDLADEVLEPIEKTGSKVHFITDESYPRRLKQCDDAPILLFQKGNVELNVQRSLAIVGTRRPSQYGLSVVESLIKSLKGMEVIVFSGLAYGIDVYVHQLCLQYQIPTYAVLGHGLDRVYPFVHHRVARDMQKNGGLLSEFVPGTAPDRENFPKRNRIVAGLSDATLVVESMSKGGSLITANLANDYNRDVFAVPGPIDADLSKGCNQLIAGQKAHLYTGPEGMLELLGWKEEKKKVENVQRQLWTSTDPLESKLLSLLLEKGEMHIDSIAAQCKMAISKTSVMLFGLEMNGAIKSLPGKRYALIK